MPKLLFNLLVLIGLIATGSTAFAIEEAQPISVLFVQTAPKGELSPISGKEGYYQLKLEALPDYIPFISHNPIRISGIYSTEQYFLNWDKANSHASPNKIPPNAGLSAIEVTLLKQTRVNLTVELASPRFDNKTNSTTYIVHILKGNETYVPKHELSHISLFITDWCVDCSGSHF